MRQKQIVTGVELVRRGQRIVRTEQITERAAAKPLAMQPPLAAGLNQPVGDQYQQHLIPPRALAARRQPGRPEAVQLQLLPQLQRQPAGTPLARPAQPELR